LKIALVAPPLLPVPPLRYGGVERIVGVLADGLHARGHDVTLFAPGDSTVACRVVATVPSGLWRDGFDPDPSTHYERTVELVLEQADRYDVVHSHLDQRGFGLTRAHVPVLATLHGRTDIDPLAAALATNPHVALVAISESQRGFAPTANWLATIHHGLPLDRAPLGDGDGDYILFVGRLSKDKGVAETVDVARQAGRRLVVAAKALAPNETDVFQGIVAPAIAAGVVDFVGEVDAGERDMLFAGARATLMLSRWPEPFGLVAIESLATGTPVVAARSGALPEIVEHGVDGFIVESTADAVRALAMVDGLDRAAIRARALARFSEGRMLDRYETVYRRMHSGSQGSHSDRV
jgi:glycosyltransferase involved in cell wall biosynthesis